MMGRLEPIAVWEHLERTLGAEIQSFREVGAKRFSWLVPSFPEPFTRGIHQWFWHFYRWSIEMSQGDDMGKSRWR
jgi:hypothetical protein